MNEDIARLTSQDTLPFGFPTDTPKIIKVIGVGGGGGNAVKNMYKEGIRDVVFVLANTDQQALAESDIPVKLQLGHAVTGGLGAGNDPEVARRAAEESIEDIKALFKDETQMVFITAGMGGGTGTGAAPVIARAAKEQGMLTVGIVTLPFKFEQSPKIMQALNGLKAIAKSVDALLVINNERLLEIYPQRRVGDGFRMVDETLTTATKSIAEIITRRGIINLDFRDVRKILKNGGVAVMSSGVASGENRVGRAIENALMSPLLYNNDIYHAKKILFNIYQSTDEQYQLILDEMNEIRHFMDKFEESDIEVIWGLANDPSLGENVKITVLATGFGMDDIPVDGDEKSDAAAAGKLYGEELGRTALYIYTMEDEDMDNEDVINAIEAHPVVDRSKQQLEEMKALSRKRTQENMS